MSPGVGLDECLRNGMPEDALRYYMPAGDAGAAADLVERLALPAWWQGRVTTVRGWYLWLEEQGATGGTRWPRCAPPCCRR